MACLGGSMPPLPNCRPMRMAYFDIMSTPYKTWFSVCVTAALFMGIPSVISHFLDKATAHQCLTHDWPINRHQNMMNFCDDYGYPTELGQL